MWVLIGRTSSCNAHVLLGPLHGLWVQTLAGSKMACNEAGRPAALPQAGC